MRHVSLARKESVRRATLSRADGFRSAKGARSEFVIVGTRRTSERARRATRGDGRLLLVGREEVQGGVHGRGHRLRGRLALGATRGPGPRRRLRRGRAVVPGAAPGRPARHGRGRAHGRGGHLRHVVSACGRGGERMRATGGSGVARCAEIERSACDRNKERFLNEARVRAPARDARRGREPSPADRTRTSDRFRRVVRRPVHRVVAVALRRHGGAAQPRSAICQNLAHPILFEPCWRELLGDGLLNA